MIIHFRRDPKGMSRFVLSILFVLAIPIILSSALSCYHQGSHQGSRPGPAHLSTLEGPWFFNANNVPGRLEFYWTGNGWIGRIFFDNVGQWEELMNIIVDPYSGHVQFHRPAGKEVYSGTLSDRRIAGTFGYGSVGSFPWEAWRPR